ncbi:hypothetical protein G5714_024623 [Onychostoma macrolepis]|uniref:Uncharacterized protein n=1 Tax=Onychostoma macrolepis TaxID=369639 RepID=A0A7J6BHW9_9TELE|nr:hypothetical protein G5714_024623 [Onychostoma macrolepis]
MLFHVILADDDIRRVQIESLPETVDELKTILQNRLDLEGDIVVQFQDPEFNNELCNLTEMSDLPPERPRLKIGAEFMRLVSTDFQQSFFDGLDKYVPRLLQMYRVRTSSSSDLRSLLEPLDAQTSGSDVINKNSHSSHAHQSRESQSDHSFSNTTRADMGL